MKLHKFNLNFNQKFIEISKLDIKDTNTIIDAHQILYEFTNTYNCCTFDENDDNIINVTNYFMPIKKPYLHKIYCKINNNVNINWNNCEYNNTANENYNKNPSKFKQLINSKTIYEQKIINILIKLLIRTAYEKDIIEDNIPSYSLYRFEISIILAMIFNGSIDFKTSYDNIDYTIYYLLDDAKKNCYDVINIPNISSIPTQEILQNVVIVCISDAFEIEHENKNENKNSLKDDSGLNTGYNKHCKIMTILELDNKSTETIFKEFKEFGLNYTKELVSVVEDLCEFNIKPMKDILFIEKTNFKTFNDYKNKYIKIEPNTEYFYFIKQNVSINNLDLYKKIKFISEHIWKYYRYNDIRSPVLTWNFSKDQPLYIENISKFLNWNITDTTNLIKTLCNDIEEIKLNEELNLITCNDENILLILTWNKDLLEKCKNLF